MLTEDERESQRRFQETLGRLVNTPPKPHKPHKPKRPRLKMMEPRLKELPDRLQPLKKK